MSALRGVLALLRVGIEVPGAIAAAERALDNGKGPLGALRAFASATHGAIDDELVADLEAGLRSAIGTLEIVTDTLAELAGQRQAAQAVFDAILGVIIGVGYQAGALRWRLKGLLDG